MDTVDAIAAKAARNEAEAKTAEIVTRIASMFRCDNAWVDDWSPVWRAALVGDHLVPRLTAHQIQRGFDDLLSKYKGNQPPKPAHIWEIAKDYLEKPKPKKAETAPEEPRAPRKPIDREKAAELSKRALEHITRGQRICREHGYGTPEAMRLLDENTHEFEAWWQAERAEMQGL